MGKYKYCHIKKSKHEKINLYLVVFSHCLLMDSSIVLVAKKYPVGNGIMLVYEEGRCLHKFIDI